MKTSTIIFQLKPRAYLLLFSLLRFTTIDYPLKTIKKKTCKCKYISSIAILANLDVILTAIKREKENYLMNGIEST